VAATVLGADGRFRGQVAPGAARFSRKEQDELPRVAGARSAQGLIFLKRSGMSRGSGRQVPPSGAVEQLGTRERGDLAIDRGGPDHVTSPALDRVRQDVAGGWLVRDGALEQLWVSTLSRMFERDPSPARSAAMHHPFTSAHRRHAACYASESVRARARAYDDGAHGTELAAAASPHQRLRAVSRKSLTPARDRRRDGAAAFRVPARARTRAGRSTATAGSRWRSIEAAMLLAGPDRVARRDIAFPKIDRRARPCSEGAPVASGETCTSSPEVHDGGAE
jgi:aspartyl-tRNA synthetase